LSLAVGIHGIGDFHEALLRHGPVGEGIADQQRPKPQPFAYLRHFATLGSSHSASAVLGFIITKRSVGKASSHVRESS
jgi:hypothetical protein